MQENRKTKYTRMALRQALLALLRTTTMAEVTVTELCARADLNRGTFYLHYSNPAELLEDLEDEIFAKFTQRWRGRKEIDDGEFGLAVLRELATDPDAATLMLQPNSTLARRVFAFEQDNTVQLWKQRFPLADSDDLEYVRVFIQQGIYSVVAQWVSDGMRQSPEHMTDLLELLTCPEAAST